MTPAIRAASTALAHLTDIRRANPGDGPGVSQLPESVTSVIDAAKDPLHVLIGIACVSEAQMNGLREDHQRAIENVQSDLDAAEIRERQATQAYEDVLRDKNNAEAISDRLRGESERAEARVGRVEGRNHAAAQLIQSIPEHERSDIVKQALHALLGAELGESEAA